MEHHSFDFRFDGIAVLGGTGAAYVGVAGMKSNMLNELRRHQPLIDIIDTLCAWEGAESYMLWAYAERLALVEDFPLDEIVRILHSMRPEATWVLRPAVHDELPPLSLGMGPQGSERLIDDILHVKTNHGWRPFCLSNRTIADLEEEVNILKLEVAKLQKY